MASPWTPKQSRSYTEVSLYGQIPSTRHDQILRILAGLAAMDPQKVVERHIIYKPSRVPSQRATQVGGSQEVQDAAKRAAQKARGEIGDLWYLRLVQTAGNTAESPEPGAVLAVNGDGAGQKASLDVREKEIPPASQTSWSLRLYGLPEAGKRPVTIRAVTTENLVQQDVIRHVIGLGYSYVSEYVLDGVQFVQNNTVLLLHRILQRPTAFASNEPQVPIESIPPFSCYVPLDESGAFVLEARVRVQDGSHQESMSLAAQELLGFKEKMKGIVDLRPVERLALDTRIK